MFCRLIFYRSGVRPPFGLPVFMTKEKGKGPQDTSKYELVKQASSQSC
jgi:hypothetical protein